MNQHRLRSSFTKVVQQPFPRTPWIGLTGLALSCAIGCNSLNFMKRDGSGSWFSPSTEGASIEDVQGPLQRNLAGTQRDREMAQMADSIGFQQYEAAKSLYEQKQYAQAEKAFKKIADEHATDETGFHRKRTFKNAFTPKSQLRANYFDNPLKEDSLFLLAECRYHQELYPGAQDIYLQLLEEYPNTRHMDVCTKRLFDIALVWMDFKMTTSNEVQVASHSDQGRASKPEVTDNKPYERPSFFNFTDKTRPLTDTEGRALESLSKIWLNDPTGPLADDALMLTASHYLRVGRYADAAEAYRTLRNEFPQSPHLKDAYVLGAYVTQASYQGSAYDDKALNESQRLRQTALQMFPNLSAEEKERLKQELQQVDDAAVARIFDHALFYARKGRFDGAEMYCHAILNNHPQSKYAGKARGLLQMLPKLRQQSSLSLALQNIQADDVPSVEEMPTAQSQTGRRVEAPAIPPASAMPVPESRPQAQPAPVEPEPVVPEAEERQRPRYLPTLEMPKLKPIPLPRLWPGGKPAEEEPVPSQSEQPEQYNLIQGTE